MMDWIGDVLLKWLGSLDLVDSEQHSQENIKKCNSFFIKAWQIKAINNKKKRIDHQQNNNCSWEDISVAGNMMILMCKVRFLE